MWGGEGGDIYMHMADSLVAQLVKNLPAVRETWVRSPGWKIPWRRERLPSPVFWPGASHGLCSPWGCKESDTTERLSLLEKEMATHSSTFFWRIPWTEEPGGLQSMGSQSWTRPSDLTHSLTTDSRCTAVNS